MAYRETQIDELFPVAGVDNESQGFRDNFSAIKESLIQARADVEDLQDTRLNKTDPESDLFDNTISNVNLANASFEAYTASGTINASQNINYANGSAQVFQLTGSTDPLTPITFTLANFPEAGRLGKIRVHLFSDQTGAAQYFNFTSDQSGPTFYYPAGFPNTLSVSGTTPTVFEFWTIDAGTNIYVNYYGVMSTASSAPRLLNVTEAERDAITPEFGSIVLNTDTYRVQVYKPADTVTTDGNFLVGEQYLITTPGDTDWAVVTGVAGTYTTGDIITVAVADGGGATGEAKLIGWEDH